MKIKTCRICLVMDVKMLNLGNTELKKFIESIFSLYGFKQNLNALHYACYECKAYLEKSFKFIQRVLKAQQVLYDMLKEKKKVCQSDLQNLDRNKLGLNSNLKKLDCIIDLDYRPSHNTTDSIDDCMHRSKEGVVEIKTETTYTDSIMKDKDKLLEKECFVEIKKEVVTVPLARTFIYETASDFDDESPMTNNETSDLHACTARQNCTVSKTNLNIFSQCCTVPIIDTVKQANIVRIKNENQDPSSYIETNTIITNTAIPNTEIVKKENECCAEIKPEGFPEPLASTCAASDISLESEEWDKKSKQINFSSEQCSDIMISCKNVTNFDNINEDNQNVSLSNIKSAGNFKINLSSTSLLSNHFNSSGKEMNKKGKKKKEDDYQLACSEEPTDSKNDKHDDGGRRLKKSEKLVYPRKCDHCNYEVPLRKEHYIHYLRFHKDVIEEYPYTRTDKTSYSCKFCGKISKVFKNHKIHESSHGERTVQCTICPKKFTCTAKMKAHLRCVHSKKRYECDYCGKISKTRSDCILHTRIHTGEKPYKCNICGVRFAHGGNKIAHIRTVHQHSNK